ncbi:MAG: histidine kinase [Clostridia bacterium]|nr:histidine kinase [Clostridia bacterium]
MTNKKILELSQKIEKKLRAMSLLKRLIALVTFLIIVPTVSINIVLLFQYEKNIKEETSVYASQYIQSVSEITKQRLVMFDNIAQNISANEELKMWLLQHHSAVIGRDWERAEKYKKYINNYLYNTTENEYILNLEIINSYDEFNQINYENSLKGGRVADKEGLIASDIYKKAVSASGITCWYDLKNTDDIIISQLNGYTFDTNIMLMKAIPNSWEEEPLGIILINISTNLFTDDFLPSDNLSENLFLVSDRGGISTLTAQSRIELDNDEIRYVTEHGGENVYLKKNNEKYRVFVKEITSTGFYVIQMIKDKNMTKTIDSIRWMVIFVNLLLVIPGVLLSYVIVKSINNPLEKLMRSMDKSGKDNEIETGYKDDVGAKDEIAYLGDKYNSMLSRIDELIQRVYKMQIINQEEEIRRKEAQLEALRMQINPHFIYNMLEVIRWKSIEQNDGENHVSKVIQAFAGVLRRVTRQTEKLVTIEKEVEQAGDYIDVLNLIFDKNIVFGTEIDDEVKKCETVNFVLQPLIENAVIHGFKNTDDNAITIKAERENEKLIIIVSDNGIGMSEEKLAELSKNLESGERNGKSIGLYNTNERIKLMFGEEYGLSVKSNGDRGISVFIRMPLGKRSVHDA